MSDTLATRAPSPPDSRAPRRTHLPGEVGIWVFVLGDMTMFGAFFGCFVHDRASRAALFTASQATLHISFGAINTGLLLTGSLFVVWAVHASRGDALAEARRWLTCAFACAALFAVDKALEYGDKLAHGITPATNLYFMYFYMFTGLHAVHLIIGMIVLARMRRLCAQPELTPTNRRTIEVGASYWHLVDLLWVVLFALLYLMA
ncbi:MAG TPA: cytochrome c oxidase subunit 3 [Pseudonocardia sp.]